MNLNRYFIYSLIVFIAFAGGRYSIQQNNTDTVVDTDKTIDTDKNQHTVIEIIEPDGTTKTTKTIDTNTKTRQDEVTHTDTKIEPVKRSSINISALAINDFNKSGIIPVYGVSVSKELIGPITVGAFGLANKTIGLSVGVNF